MGVGPRGLQEKLRGEERSEGGNEELNFRLPSRCCGSAAQTITVAMIGFSLFNMVLTAYGLQSQVNIHKHRLQVPLKGKSEVTCLVMACLPRGVPGNNLHERSLYKA